MFKPWFPVIILLATSITTLAQATIYTWTDEHGTVHFSDQPNDHAKEVNINVPLPAKKTATQVSSSPQQAKSAQGERHLLFDTELPQHTTTSSIQIMAPLHEQTIRNNEGIITLSAVANRTMDKGHSAKLYLDGKAYGKSQTQLDWRLVDIDRGSHQLQVKLLKYGKVIASSEKITVFLHRASRLHPRGP
ncbi:DUF4124 domain-containing protein [Photobacterium kagoshimensis]|uniref:DUF4124 domain-containing protein n=1 Tax=Photobacterium kagoshimensis TaxID=2910242 RepID=UPI003D0BA7E0